MVCISMIVVHINNIFQQISYDGQHNLHIKTSVMVLLYNRWFFCTTDCSFVQLMACCVHSFAETQALLTTMEEITSRAPCMKNVY